MVFGEKHWLLEYQLILFILIFEIKMPIIKIHGLKPGMVLATGIENHVGKKLLLEGTQLAEKHILNLKAWGITEANIQGEVDEPESTQELENIDPEIIAKAEREAKALFCHSNQDHPAVAELMRLFCLDRLKNMPGMGGINVK